MMAPTFPVLWRLILAFWICGKTTIISASHVPVSDINYFFEHGEAPEGSTFDFPTYLTSTINISLRPLPRILDTAETVEYQRAIRIFYQQIFDSQADYNLKVRPIKVLHQSYAESDHLVTLETEVGVNFRPHSDENGNHQQHSLTNHELHNIVINLANRFDAELVKYLRKQHLMLSKIEEVHAYSSEANSSETNLSSLPIIPMDDHQDTSRGRRELWLYIAVGVGTLVIMGGMYAGFLFCDRNGGRKRMMVHPEEKRNISPFRDDDVFEIEFPIQESSRLAIPLDDKHDSESDPKFSWQPSELDPESPTSPFSRQPHTPRPFPKRLTLDDVMSKSDPTPSNRKARDIDGVVAELWAPAGKLGVALDVVNGRPTVYKIKPGSPLERFLLKGDQIVAIDEINTTRMSPADVTSLMVRRMRQRRRIQYVRGRRLSA